ncbi:MULTISPECIES: TIGR03943 family putative permease subunit [unclassified Frankia]|uniref:TIGR03943 family putative permease subunit n=1 Tax=unclassified Frankia TaxID=2632575 RepID=UPI002AD38395|nr:MULTISPECIES: TIGR03943 family protein [unclassified Frankia]
MTHSDLDGNALDALDGIDGRTGLDTDDDHKTTEAGAGTHIGPIGGLLLLIMGITFLRLAQTGAYTSYVRVGMRIPLLAAGGLVTLLGTVALVRYASAGNHDQTQSAHRHGPPGVALLLLLPVAVIYMVAPPSLGAFSARRATITVPPPRAVPYGPLHPGPDGIATLPMREIVERTYDRGRSLAGTTVRMTGFVAVPEGRQILLTRFVIRCCAADAEAAAVDLTLPDGVAAPAENTWVTVLATWDGSIPDHGRPKFAARTLDVIPTPVDPYET